LNSESRNIKGWNREDFSLLYFQKLNNFSNPQKDVYLGITIAKLTCFGVIQAFFLGIQDFGGYPKSVIF
jgi:hypothetical protein